MDFMEHSVEIRLSFGEFCAFYGYFNLRIFMVITLDRLDGVLEDNFLLEETKHFRLSNSQ